MAFKDIWRPRVDGVDDADSSAVNEIAEAVIKNEIDISNKQDELTEEQLKNIEDVPNKVDKDYVNKIIENLGEETIIKTPVALELTNNKRLTTNGIVDANNNFFMSVSQYIEVSEGEQYEIHLHNNWNNWLYAFYDDADTVISFEKSEGSKAGTLFNGIVTVPEGATKMLVAPYRYTLYYVNKVTYEYKDETYKVAFLLQNKNVLNFGDSIAMGLGANSFGYAHIIARNNNMNLLNKAVSGATMRVKSGETNNIGKQIDEAISYNSTLDFDFVLLEGGTNDTLAGTIGEIISGYDVSTCDDTTFTGALEKNISKIRNAWWSANIIYVLVHKIGERSEEKQKQFHDRIIAVCNKWGIPYVDIYNEGQISSCLDVLSSNCFPEDDLLHPNNAGYEKFYVPPITAKMKELI